MTRILRPRSRPRWPLVVVVPALYLGTVTAGAPSTAADTAASEVPAPVTITITSDQQVNQQLLWNDANGRPRHQFGVTLNSRGDGHRWSGSLTLTPTAESTRAHPVQRVIFISNGEFAACAIATGETTVAEHTAQGTHAMAVCQW